MNTENNWKEELEEIKHDASEYIKDFLRTNYPDKVFEIKSGAENYNGISGLEPVIHKIRLIEPEPCELIHDDYHSTSGDIAALYSDDDSGDYDEYEHTFNNWGNWTTDIPVYNLVDIAEQIKKLNK